MGISSFEFQELQRRADTAVGAIARRSGKVSVSGEGTKAGDARDKSRDALYEKELHDFIVEECKKRRWLPFHNFWGEKSVRTPGEMDFEIWAPGRVILIECKAKGKKLDGDQRDIHHWLNSMGHMVHVAYSKEQILNIFNNDTIYPGIKEDREGL